MLHIIANPASQSGIGRHKIRTLTNLLMTNDLEATLHITKHPGHAGELAAELPLTEEDRLIIVGGDGSIDETIAGLKLPCSTPIAVLPAGSGNDFARGMKISHDPEDLVASIKENNAPLTIDLAEATPIDDSLHTGVPHRFAVSCGLGMDAAICLAMNGSRLKRIFNRLHIGKLTYLIIGIQTIFQTSRKKRASIKLTLDDNQTYTFRNVAFLSVHNLPYEGGGFPFCPDALPTDGKLDICVIHVPCRILMLPILVANLCGGNHGIFRHWVTLLQAKEVHVESDRPMTFHTDGEAVPDQRGFQAKALPHAIPYIK